MDFLNSEKLEKLKGKKFGKLTVIDFHKNETGRQIICTVQCDCGSEPKDVPLYVLTNGNTKSCGCSRKENVRQKRDIIGMKLNKLTIIKENQKTGAGIVKCECGNTFEIPNIRGRITGLKKDGQCKECRAKNKKKKYDDLQPGQKFNYYRVIKRVQDDAHGQPQYQCICQCGTKKVVLGKYLVNGQVKSCGCIRGLNFMKKNTLKGLTGTTVGKKLYKIWFRGLQKAKEENVKFFPEWANDKKGFEQFYNWATLKKEGFDMTKRPYLARIDDNADWTQENCYFSRTRYRSQPTEK